MFKIIKDVKFLIFFKYFKNKVIFSHFTRRLAFFLIKSFYIRKLFNNMPERYYKIHKLKLVQKGIKYS